MLTENAFQTLAAPVAAPASAVVAHAYYREDPGHPRLADPLQGQGRSIVLRHCQLLSAIHRLLKFRYYDPESDSAKEIIETQCTSSNSVVVIT